jgi:hypothetical protein
LRNGGVVEFGQSTIVAGWTVAREPEHNRALCETLTLTAAVRLATGFRADVNERGLTVGPPCCHGLASPEAVLLKGWERMLGTLLIAAAGYAEVVWLWEMVIMTGILLVIGLFATIAMGLRSTVSLMVSMMLLVIFMAICRPWYLFMPFDAEAYEDHDVVRAAEKFRVVGMLWILTTALVVTAAVVAWRRERSPIAGESAGNPS